MSFRDAIRSLGGVERVVIVMAIMLGLAVRLAHLTGPIDENASAWRQAETAYMTWRLAEESPPEFFHSKVPYRGPYDVHLAELPVQPLMTALGYKLLGRESLVLARCVTLMFFLGAAWFLYLCIARAAHTRWAWYAVAMYMACPIGIDYSRAIHTDFCTIFFAHAFLYFAMVFTDSRRWRYWLLSCLCASLAFLLKAPYCFYLAIPLGVYRLSKGGAFKKIVIDALLLGALFVLPLVWAFLYNHHRIALEADYIESVVYHSKWSADMTRSWFFGTLADRLDWSRWLTLLRRCFFEVLTPMGVILAMAGLFIRRKTQDARAWLFSMSWCLGALVYVLTMFKIVSSHHEYYVLPLLAPSAILMAGGCAHLGRRMPGRFHAVSIVLVVVTACVWFGTVRALRAAGNYRNDEQRIVAGQIMGAETSPESILLSVTKGRSTGKSDPRILYYAKRRGWPIEFGSLTADNLELFRDAGATHAGLLLAPWFDPVAEEFGILAAFEYVAHEMISPDTQESIGHLVLFDLGVGK